jgi:hypothetical protein
MRLIRQLFQVVATLYGFATLAMHQEKGQDRGTFPIA